MAQFVRRPVIGLALGGGGARGLAHIGVLKILTASGVPIDTLIGSSMGGLIAALYAAGISPEEMEAEAFRMSKASQMVRLLDLAPPRRGLVKGERLRAYLTKIFGKNPLIEELPVPLSLVAVDLHTGKEVILTCGPLIEAVMATMAVPGIFSPVEINDQCLVDGGVLNNVPADVVRHHGAETVIAVDVNSMPTGDDLADNPDTHPGLTNLLPPLVLDVYRAEMIMVDALTQFRLKKAHPEVLIQPKIPPNIDIFLGFAYAEEIIAAGEEATRKALPKIKQVIRPSLRWPRAISDSGKDRS
jgi:NTE family protein